MGRGRRGPARAGRWPGARRRDVLRGGGWRRGGQNQPKPRCTAVVLVARQTGALTRGRRCKSVCGLSEGPPSCYCLWFECVVPPCVESSFPLFVRSPGAPGGPTTPRGDHSPALRGFRPRGRDRRGPARAGGWPGARGRDVMRGEGWRRDAEGETVPTPRTPTVQHTVVLHKVARYCARARAANVCAYARPAV